MLDFKRCRAGKKRSVKTNLIFFCVVVANKLNLLVVGERENVTSG
jgi:hypothetical protein